MTTVYWCNTCIAEFKASLKSTARIRGMGKWCSATGLRACCQCEICQRSVRELMQNKPARCWCAERHENHTDGHHCYDWDYMYIRSQDPELRRAGVGTSQRRRRNDAN